MCMRNSARYGLTTGSKVAVLSSSRAGSSSAVASLCATASVASSASLMVGELDSEIVGLLVGIAHCPGRSTNCRTRKRKLNRPSLLCQCFGVYVRLGGVISQRTGMGTVGVSKSGGRYFIV